jgi:O-6-methylguanine DNA methyltransferase
MEGLRRRLARLGDVRAPRTVLPAVLLRARLADRYARVRVAGVGLFVAWNHHGVSAVDQAASTAAFERRFRRRFGRPAFQATVLPTQLAARIEDVVKGGRRRPLRCDLRGLSSFARAVLLKTREIPRGEVRPYTWIAAEIGRPGSARAVGAALAANPVPLLLPCHRVVRTDGGLGGYIFGLGMKRAVLAAEGLRPSAIEASAREGVRYVGSDTTKIYCFPTCHRARRIARRHRVEFRGERQAAAAGYRPCRVCRPSSAR